jgi:hypothetical protein
MKAISIDPKPFLESMPVMDQCIDCGADLEGHEVDGAECLANQESEAMYHESCLDVDRRESELAEMEY